MFFGAKERTQFDNAFQDAVNRFDKETHESMTREAIKTKDVVKMVQPWRVLVACFLISGFKKTVDRLVR